MPATEQIWRKPKLMHSIFGVSALVMLVGTVWMFAKDHTREWKAYQTKYRSLEQWTVDARIREQETKAYELSLAEAREVLAAAQSEMIPKSAVERFVAELVADAERREVPPPDASPLEQAYARVQEAHQAREASRESGVEGQEADGNAAQQDRAVANARTELLEQMQDARKLAKLSEDNLARDEKFRKADLTAAVSVYGLAVGEGKPVDAIQQTIDQIQSDVEELTAQLGAAKTHRMALDEILGEVTAGEQEAAKALDEVVASVGRLEQQRLGPIEKSFDWLIRLPVIDAFYTGEVGIEQDWTPDLTVNYNFSRVARFDRCVTCHRAINKTAPGSAVDPAYQAEHEVTVTLTTPDAAPESPVGEDGSAQPPTVADVYGIEFAATGRVDRDDVTVQFVWPETRGAMAGLEMGDVILRVEEDRVYSHDDVRSVLLGAAVPWGQPIELTVRRGVPHPFVTHPRLDLFVGSMSPHKKGDFGCTICHEGQGSATEFKWASHTPNDPEQALEWNREHGWFDNVHWVFPMNPKRFIESGCLKCHHEVTELAASERFPDPPAPKLLEGYQLIRKFGCFGCHEINGYDGPDRRIGPDMRLEPNVYAAAYALMDIEGLSDEERGWAAELVERPENDEVRRRLWEVIDQDEQLGRKRQSDQPARLPAQAHKLGRLLKDSESPGAMSKVGPSLRFVGSKLDFEFLYAWIRRPADFRPTSRMPQVFGLWEHLDEKGLEMAERFEPIEVRAIAEYLLGASKPFDYATPSPEGVTEQPSTERGKQLFQTRGCLACHSHQDFPKIQSTQAPDLSRIGAKLDSSNGRQWLLSWLKEPAHYHTRTKMPDLLLEPIAEIDVQGQPTGKVTDPIADIAQYLLASRGGRASSDVSDSSDQSDSSDWAPEGVPSRDLSQADQDALKDLALEHLTGSFPRRRAAKYLDEGIPERLAGQVKGAEAVLIGMSEENRLAKQLEYVGVRTIAKYGCAGCHDIPGFEDAGPIGTALTDWARKKSSKLAFEQITQFLAKKGLDGHGGQHHADGEEHTAGGEEHTAGGHGHGLDPTEFDEDTGFYLQALSAHRREGFLWQKLRMPRSYDYEKTGNKGYNEWLRMPKFTFDANDPQADAAAREAIMTFVLGLVAEPPMEKYVYSPVGRQEAIVQGRKVLDKYNCKGCHSLKMQQWEFDFSPGEFGAPPETADYPFLEPHFTPEQIAKSLETDRRGMRHAVVHGMPVLKEDDGQPDLRDEEGVPIEPGDEETAAYYQFDLWQPALIGGESYPVGSRIAIRDDGIKQRPAEGGDLADYLFPVVIAQEKERNPQAKGSEAWGWLPPPLAGEGRKVQPDWLHKFLLDPHTIRPSTVLRMPKFKMTSDEARWLVDYFAAVDAAEYPYQYVPRRSAGHLAAKEAAHPGHLDGGLAIITDRNFCVQCHSVGDFQPEGTPTGLAPNLDLAHERLQPQWLRDWIANPKRTTPYTGMPANVPFKNEPPLFGAVNQELYKGTSFEQVDALVDFLMNFDNYAKQKISIKPLVKPPAAATSETAGQSP